jgi:hypothetical protein
MLNYFLLFLSYKKAILSLYGNITSIATSRGINKVVEILLLITYSTTKPAILPSRLLFLSTTNFLLIKQYLNNITQLLFKRKADLILPFKPILLANLRAYNAL